MCTVVGQSFYEKTECLSLLIKVDSRRDIVIEIILDW